MSSSMGGGGLLAQQGHERDAFASPRALPARRCGAIRCHRGDKLRGHQGVGRGDGAILSFAPGFSNWVVKSEEVYF
uniref:Uncharacterized protein n=1 Tax=Oryza punctata TaxID=4537 RepID=A0A0E0JRM6_ORYPU